MTQKILETHHLHVNFGGLAAINNVNLRIHKGEIRCLIGPNGAGKSTLFRCLSGMQNVSSGQIYFLGQSITNKHCHAISKMGMGIKTQIPNVMEELNTYEHIWLAARCQYPYQRAVDKTESIIEKLSLRDITNSTLSTLAHGRRQIVELAMVMVQEPSLLLLDEPAAGMNDSDLAMIAEILLEINKSATIVVVDHNIHFIRKIANIVSVLYQGTIFMEDRAHAVLSNKKVQDIYLGNELI
ncbi:MAG: ATP-binding cassette domain-containing protein [Pseudomonadota bacterium]